MSRYARLLEDTPGSQLFVIRCSSSPQFKIYGQLCMIYPHARNIPILDLLRSPYITLTFPGDLNLSSFFWVWCYINSVETPKLQSFSEMVMIYPILLLLGISPRDKRLKERLISSEPLNDEECQLSRILSDRVWYSFATSHILRSTGISTRSRLLDVAISLGKKSEITLTYSCLEGWNTWDLRVDVSIMRKIREMESIGWKI